MDGTGPVAVSAPGRQWLLVSVLTAVSMLALIDKNLLQLMVDPIKADLHLSDVELSLILGAAFALANLAASLPAGWMADRGYRRLIIAGGVVTWSVATAASGAARSFGALFAARAAVGCGEGIIPPACYSLLRDGVDRQRRGRALAVYTMATTAGSGVALLICGALIAAIAARGIDRLPLIGAARPWQTALATIGLIGLPVSLLTLVIPRVGGADRNPAGEGSYRDALAFLRARAPVMLPLLAYSVLQSMLTATMGSWVPALIGRTFHLTPQAIGPILGSLLIVCGMVGLWLVGVLIDRLNASGRHGAAIVGFAAAVLFTVAGTIMPHVRPLGAFWAIEVLVLLGTMPFLVVVAEIVAREAPARMVGKVMAVFLLLQALIGYSLAPTLTALLTEHVYESGGNPLGAAISTMVAALGSIEVAMIALAWRALRRGDARRPGAGPRGALAGA